MKKTLITIASLFVVLTAGAQTRQYIKIETTHFRADKVYSKAIKYEGGTIDFTDKIISIDKEANKPQLFDIARSGDFQPEDEGYLSKEYICLTTTKTGGLKAVKIIAIYTPKKVLCDLIVKQGKSSSIDYCLTEK